MTDDPDRTFWIAIRQALLMLLDALERRWGIEPTTKECRDVARREMRGTR